MKMYASIYDEVAKQGRPTTQCAAPAVQTESGAVQKEAEDLAAVQAAREAAAKAEVCYCVQLNLNPEHETMCCFVRWSWVCEIECWQRLA